jgi:hypothetical protein
MDSNFRYRGTKTVDFRSIPGMAGDRLSWSDIMALLGPALTRRRLILRYREYPGDPDLRRAISEPRE